jgi:hypothetical protein
MRFARIFLLVAAPFCFAQTIPAPDNTCMSARILTPSGAFPMPTLKTPDMLTMKGSVISTAPPCTRAQPKSLMAKRIVVAPGPRMKPGGLKLLPNPFAPVTK